MGCVKLSWILNTVGEGRADRSCLCTEESHEVLGCSHEVLFRIYEAFGCEFEHAYLGNTFH